MMRKSLRLVACALSIVACSGAPPQITVGVILSQTGMLATAGQDHLLAVELAVDEINRAGGVHGSLLTVVNEDDRSTPAGAATAAATLIARDHAPAILGAVTSDATLAAEGMTAPAKVVLISGSATSPALSGVSPYFFRTCSSDALQGELLAKRAWARGFKRIAVVWVPGAYGMGLSSSFAANFTSLGGTVTFNQMFTPGQSSYHDLLQQVFADPPEAVLLVAYAVDGAQIIRDYNTDFAFLQIFWFFTDSTQDSSFVAAVGASNFTFMHEGTGAPIPTGQAYRTFAAAFMRSFGKAPEGYSPEYYDATYLVALGLAAASKSDGESLRAQLRSVADPPGTMVGPGQWASAVALLRAGGQVNYEGASGSVDLDGNGDVIGPYDIWQVRQGVITPVEPSVLP
jgi:ABC-type branched-subunit amino acid transport system substrate-binding protein